MKIVFLIIFLLISFVYIYSYFHVDKNISQAEEKTFTLITSAEKYMEYRKTKDDYPRFSPPTTVITIYSTSLLKKILTDYSYRQGTGSFKELYLLDNGKTGVFYIGGMGAPALIHKMEELIAFGVKKFISVGYAGALTKEFSVGDFVIHSKALSEDGVGHLYIGKWSSFSYANLDFKSAWTNFMKEKHPEHVAFKNAVSCLSQSYSAKHRKMYSALSI